MKKIMCTIMFAMLLLLAGFRSGAQHAYPYPEKKILDFCQSQPTPQTLLDSLSFMEKRPVDAITVRLPDEAGGGRIFDTGSWLKSDPEARSKQIELLKKLPEERRQECFITIFAGSDIDWFSDADWKIVEEHLEYVMECAVAGNFKGILWDAEPYFGINPWRLTEQPGYGSHSYKEYYDKVRERGASFISTIQKSMPDCILFSLFFLSYPLDKYDDVTPFSVSGLDNPYEERRWSLYAAFCNGNIDAVGPDVRIVDGNEHGYYYFNHRQFYEGENMIRREALVLVDPAIRDRYLNHIELAQPIPVNWFTGDYRVLFNAGMPFQNAYCAHVMTPYEQCLWFEHNVYHALHTSCEYVWMWTERPYSWWYPEKVPEGFEDALMRAKDKYENMERLGYRMEPLIEDARKRAMEDRDYLLKRDKELLERIRYDN